MKGFTQGLAGIIMGFGIDVAQSSYQKTPTLEAGLSTITQETNYVQEGDKLYEQRRYGESLQKFELALKEKPGNVDIIVDIASALSSLGRNEEAEKTYEQAIKINPNSVKAHRNFGAHFRGLNKLEKAKEHYEKALELNPDSVKVNISMALFYHKGLGDNDQAKSFYQKAFKIDPNNAETNYRIARFYDDLGELENAIPFAKRAVWKGNKDHYGRYFFKLISKREKLKKIK